MLIAHAPGSVDTHDDWDPTREVVHAGPDSLYIGVYDHTKIASVVCILGTQVPEGLVQLYDGSLLLPQDTLTIADSGGSMNLEIPLPEAESAHKLAVYGDPPTESTLVVISFDGAW